MKEIYEKIEAFARDKMKEERVTGMDHTLRVWSWCKILGSSEDVDMEVIKTAALLHDVSCPTKGRKTHYEDSAQMTEELLRKIEYPEKKIPAILHVIRAHSRFGGPDPETREAEILYDADVLDFIGAIGLVRGVTRGFEENYKGNVSEALALFEGMINRVKSARALLYTKKAREVAERRFHFMKTFIARLGEELDFKE